MREGKNLIRPLLCRSLLLLMTLVCMSGMLTACGKADLSAYGEEPITISGLKDEEFTVTPNELAEMKCVSRTDTGATQKAGTVKAYGPLMSTFVEQYGYTMSDFSKIRFICRDEYKTVLQKEYLTDYEIVLSVASGSDPLSEKEQPLRILVPEADSYRWAYSVERIEFVKS